MSAHFLSHRATFFETIKVQGGGIVLATAMVFLLPLISQARETLFVDRTAVVQGNFLGLNAVYHGFTYLPESLEMGMTNELRALELARVKESGIRIARTFYRPDWAMGDGPWLHPDWNSTKMKALYVWLADMQKLGVDVALNMGWWFPRDVIWNRDQHLPAYPDDLRSYCQWLSESLHQMVQVRGFTNVKYLVMFTEPADDSGDAPGGKKVWNYYREVLRAVDQRLKDDGRRQLVQLVGPNTSQAPAWLDKATQELNDVIDIYASHNYNFTSYQEWHDMATQVKAAVASTGKPFWIDEYGVQDFALRKSGYYGTVLALANAAFLNAGAQASFLWILNDQYYPSPLKYHTNGDSFLDGKHSWGLFPWLPEDQTPRPAWNAFVLLTRFMGQAGGKVLQTKGIAEVPIAAVERQDGDFNVLVVNGGKEPREVAIDFSSPIGRPLYRHAYNPVGKEHLHTNQEAMPELRAGRSVHDALLAGEVVVYSTRGPGFDDIKARIGVQDGVRADQTSPPGGGSENLALHKAVEASSADVAWPAANVTDGERLSAWRSTGSKQRRSESVTIDLGQAFQVQRVEVFPGYGGERSQEVVMAAAVLVSVSADKKGWQRIPIKDDHLPENAFLQVTFPSVKARYIRLESVYPEKSTPGPTFQARLGEVKVFGY